MLACVLPLTALAQWVWVDKDGRKVYSDRSPPAEVPARNILKQPGGKPAPSEPQAAQAPAMPPSSLRIPGKDKGLEDRKKQAEAAEAEKKKAEEEQLAKVRAENCERAKRAKASFDSGIRIAQSNAKGEREILDDSARAAETKRIQEIIDVECKT